MKRDKLNKMKLHGTLDNPIFQISNDFGYPLFFLQEIEKSPVKIILRANERYKMKIEKIDEETYQIILEYENVL
jgi:hypothetical protein